MSIKIKRVYELTNPNEPNLFLIDRLWPRGISKAQLYNVLWLKELAPSSSLRQWFNHDDAKYLEFRQKYLAELATNKDALSFKQKYASQDITLLYAAKSPHNNAVILKEWLASSF